jgi:hypothetical protein
VVFVGPNHIYIFVKNSIIIQLLLLQILQIYVISILFLEAYRL